MANRETLNPLILISVFIIIGLLLGVIVGGFFAWQNKKEKERAEQPLQAQKTLQQKNKITKKQDNKKEEIKLIEVKDWQIYENKTYKYKIKYPKKWFVSKDSEEAPWLTNLASYDLDKTEEDALPTGVKVEILVQGNPRNLLLRDWVNEGHVLSGEPKLSQEIKVSGLDAIREELEFEGPTINVTFFHGQDVFTISYTGSVDEYSQYLRAFEEMLNSIEIEK